MASEKGLIEIKESTKVDPNGTVRVMKTPKITGAGQQYFVNLFLNKASDNATA
jgi:anti-repressor protein